MREAVQNDEETRDGRGEVRREERESVHRHKYISNHLHL